ncbi:MAG: flavodoxin family protein [Coriobacteriia bacterium]
MRVVAFNGSARRDGNTAILVRKAFEPLEEAGVECELVQLSGETLHGCRACGWCRKNPVGRCNYDDDIVNECIAKMREADGIILASPTYFAGISPEIKALADRAFYVARGNDHMFSRKIGAALVAVRRGGAIAAFDALNHYFFISDMVVPGSYYWNDGVGAPKGAVAEDEEGMKVAHRLGENMLWLLRMREATAEAP